MLNSVRARLTFWYVFVFGILLISFSVFVYIFILQVLYERLDQTLANSTQAVATEFQSEVEECNGDTSAGALETFRELQLPGVYTAIFEGEKLLASSNPDREEIGTLLFPIEKGSGIFLQTIDGFGDQGARLAAVPIQIDGRDFTVSVAEPLYELTEQLKSVRRIFYFGLPATLLITGLGGFFLAKNSLSSVVDMSNQAKRISATNLQERLEVSNPKDELGQLAAVFNELLARLEHSFVSMREFMADASHELRTPLAIIRGESDVALSQDRTNKEYKDSLAVIQDEAGRLSRIVDDLMALAYADAGQHPLKFEEFYLNDLVEETCRAMQVLAMKKGVHMTIEPSEDFVFRGDEDMLRRLLLNLLDNAVKYTPAGGQVAVKLATEKQGAKITVTDTGIGIPAEAAPHIFERFYRVDKARSRADGGSGLGLSIAKWVAEAHQGSINLISQPGYGSTFTVLLRA
jgi:heavy metal sensor kinase